MCTPLVIFADTPMGGTTIAHCMCRDRHPAVQAEKVVVGETIRCVSVDTYGLGMCDVCICSLYIPSVSALRNWIVR